MLGVFLASFSAALASHAPGGLGVLELTFLKGMPDAPPAQVIAALLTFRLLYLIAPLIVSLGVVVMFENRRLRRALSGAQQRMKTRPSSSAATAIGLNFAQLPASARQNGRCVLNHLSISGLNAL